LSKTRDYYFDLPPELIAQTPLEQRDGSRMLTLDRKSGVVQHRNFSDFPSFLQSGDCLVLNNSRVLPARLLGERLPGGGNCEVLLLVDKGEKIWECLVKPGRKMRVGSRVSFGNGALIGEALEVLEDGNRLLRFEYEGIFLEVLERLGKMPLPPYIRERLADGERYQTVYSKHSGSAAAPTAGLHFTPELLAQLVEKGVKLAYVTLHVGLGTFRPVKVDDFTTHQMHSELCMVGKGAAAAINETKKQGGRVVCIGTTSCRTIESMADACGAVQSGSKWTDIFIYPGYNFKVMDGLLTNFHLPESTLIMLVSALAGRGQVLSAYQQAVAERYRFFSFGDCMYVF
jgi:S-adenosylmethionine:tRNA ribosyltransferase-isomerase